MNVATLLRDVGLEPPAAPPDEVVAARATAEEALRLLLRVPAGAVQRPWSWRGRDVSARYGFYRCYELLEAAAVAAEGAAGRRPEGARIVGKAVGALWDLHGLLLPLSDAEAARAPEGEWSVLQTLAHVDFGQTRFTTGSAWAAHRARTGGDLPVVPEAWRVSGAGAAPPPAADLATARRGLDASMDACAALFGAVDDELSLGAPSTWSGYDVPVRFRLGRLAGHLREHTVQVEKTLDLLGRRLDEVERMIGVVAGAYGRLEGACVGVRPVPGAVGRAVEECAAVAREAAAAAG